MYIALGVIILMVICNIILILNFSYNYAVEIQDVFIVKSIKSKRSSYRDRSMNGGDRDKERRRTED